MPERWIFFDCFNTLLDDFDDSGDISGLGPIAELPVAAGRFESAAAFRAAYAAARANNWGFPPGEVTLGRRLATVLDAAVPRNSRDTTREIVDAMLRTFEREYPLTLRLTPGARDMLAAWADHARLAVVSNFYLPDWPDRMLARFGDLYAVDLVCDDDVAPLYERLGLTRVTGMALRRYDLQAAR